jgi:hypothetical protein
MPIKFRCKYCNQLMGIARRKAGTEVHCPTCNGNLVVPHQDEVFGQAAAAAPVFERSDFEQYLHADVGNQPAVAAPPAPAPPMPGTVWSPQSPPDMVDVEPAALHPVAPPGIILSTGMATLLTIGIIFLMALSFMLGVLVGRALVQ